MTYLMSYVVRRQPRQHVGSNLHHNTFPSFATSSSAIFGLNIQNGVQYILCPVALVAVQKEKSKIAECNGLS